MRTLFTLAYSIAFLALSDTTFAAEPNADFSAQNGRQEATSSATYGSPALGVPISAAVIVSFADSSAVFRPDADQAAQLGDAKNAALVAIRGRTSTDKASAKDEALALSRALSARSYLIARGVSPLKVTVNFASAADFISDNSTPEGKHENQRVEVEMVYVATQTN